MFVWCSGGKIWWLWGYGRGGKGVLVGVREGRGGEGGCGGKRGRGGEGVAWRGGCRGMGGKGRIW